MIIQKIKWSLTVFVILLTLSVNAQSNDEVNCRECVPSFSPQWGETYVLSAWVHQSDSETATTFEAPAISLQFLGGVGQSLYPFFAEGPIIDGWQRIEKEFEVPNAYDLKITLENFSSTLTVNFDDIRIYPKKASLKSYVYDPISMRLMAELDENNYATFYEYDEEGILIRVKKETERGIKTIKESRNNTHKIPQ